MVDVVTVERYKSLNGYVYDKLQDAERADAEWRREHEYDLANDVVRLTKTGQRDINYLTRIEENRRYSQYPMLFVLNAKHGNQYYVAKTVSAVPKIYFEILKFNRDSEFYYTPAAKAISDEIVRTANYPAALAFVKERVDYQYENVFTETVAIYGE